MCVCEIPDQLVPVGTSWFQLVPVGSDPNVVVRKVPGLVGFDLSSIFDAFVTSLFPPVQISCAMRPTKSRRRAA